jgi:hypothetical protein
MLWGRDSGRKENPQMWWRPKLNLPALRTSLAWLLGLPASRKLVLSMIKGRTSSRT